jgi:GT2 family glycosyltransferase
MQVSVIIINYNTFQLTSDCIRSVIEHTKAVEYEIILVDNASTERDAAEFLNEFPLVKLIKNPFNEGFAKGNNLGIEASRGEFILLLNSDTLLTGDSISLSIQKMKSDPLLGVLGCRMVYPNGEIQYTARRFRSLGWELLDLFRFIPFLMSYSKRSELMLGKYFRHDEDRFCDWVNGAFFLMRREMLSKMNNGKLDDRFFMYGEDHLWCHQAREAGFRVFFFAGTSIIHINSGSTDPGKRLKLRRTMMKHELEIASLRKGRGLYYFLFRIVYTSKESLRNLVKGLAFRSSGKMIR